MAKPEKYTDGLINWYWAEWAENHIAELEQEKEILLAANGELTKRHFSEQVVSDEQIRKNIDGMYWIGSCGEVGERVTVSDIRAALEGKKWILK